MKYTKKQLIHLYLEEQLSGAQIGEQLSIPAPTIYWALRKFDIPRRRSGPREGISVSPKTQWRPGQHLSPETEFKRGEHLYHSWNKGLTKVTDPRIKAQAEKVSQKLKGGSHQDAKYSFTKEFYEKLYHKDKLSIGGIARLLGCGVNIVHYYLRKYDIPRREQMVAMAIKPSGAERRFMEIIEKYNLPFTYVGDGKLIIDGLCPDFVNTNGRKELIEVFGTYWHQEWQERERKRRFARYGFHTVVIWESELDDEQSLVNKLVQGGIL